MNNLMRAEWFRLRRTGLIKLILLIDICAAIMQFAGDGLEINVLHFCRNGIIGPCLAISCVSGIVCGTFDNRVVHYEIMKGTPPLLTILSKTLMSLCIVTAAYFLPTVILLILFDGAALTLPIILLAFVCIAKLTVFYTAMCIIFNGISGMVIAIFATAFNTIPLVILQNVAHINVVPLVSYLTNAQLMLIGKLPELEIEQIAMPLDNSNIEIKVIISFIVLSAVMILTAYKLLKERKQFGLMGI